MFSEKDNTFKGLFFQDKQMLQTFQSYPELLCLDATYKLLDLRLPIVSAQDIVSLLDCVEAILFISTATALSEFLGMFRCWMLCSEI